jgi:two-component system, response regulator YesN
LSVAVLRIVCFDIINTVLKTVEELDESRSLVDLDRIVSFSSLREFEGEMARLIEPLCLRIEAKRSHQKDELGETVVRYIHGSFTEKSFCLEEVADRFDIGMSNLSRLIKDTTGNTFSEYVSSLRMELIKTRLKETDEPVKTIIVSVGYSDAANCIRKFRILEGVTPGEYRRISK